MESGSSAGQILPWARGKSEIARPACWCRIVAPKINCKKIIAVTV